jgi:hypothetical protein
MLWHSAAASNSLDIKSTRWGVARASMFEVPVAVHCIKVHQRRMRAECDKNRGQLATPHVVARYAYIWYACALAYITLHVMTSLLLVAWLQKRVRLENLPQDKTMFGATGCKKRHNCVAH